MDKFSGIWFRAVWGSARASVSTMGRWSVALAASLAFIGIGWAQSLVHGGAFEGWLRAPFVLPAWIWWLAAYALLALSGLVAFHRERLWAEVLQERAASARKRERDASVQGLGPRTRRT